MRRIVLLTILSVAFLFSFAAAAFAALSTTNPIDIPVGSVSGGAATGGTNGTGYNATTPRPNPTPPSTTAVQPSIYLDNGKIHSNYSANTDACASCHATHTAVGENLLQWANITWACKACHDGTVTTTYDVISGKIANTATKTSAGLIGTVEAGLSRHSPTTASSTTSLAAGGSENNATIDKNGNWSTPFNCNACHSPHGQGGNSRILNADPNGIALQNKVSHTDPAGILTTTDPAYKIYTAPKRDWIKGYPYTEYTKIYVTNSAAPQVTTQILTGFAIDYRTGKVTFDSTVNLSNTDTVTADYVPGIHVVMDIDPIKKLTADETVKYISGMNQFCGACHTDYNTSTVTNQTGSGHALTGEYRSAYRHQVGMIWNDAVRGTSVITDTTKPNPLKFENVNVTAGTGTVMCLTCHYAHGTDDAFAGGTTSDLTRSTALKRQVNMSVCETCHQKGAASNY